MIRAWVVGHRLLAGAILALALITIAVILQLSTDTSAPGPSPQVAVPSAPAPLEPSGPASTPEARPDASTPTPTAPDFARHVVDVLFTWDTTTHDRDAIVEELLAVADPTGAETPGLVTDLEAYLPDDAWWDQLRQYEAAQWFEVDSAVVPQEWTEAEANGETASLAPGTTAVTVSGTLHRAGNVAGQMETAAAPLVLTVFVTCTDEDCSVLRLGDPGKVLDRERLH